MAGGITYRRVREIKTPLMDSVQNIFAPANPELILFPSPVAKGGTLNFSIKLKQTGLYKLQIADVGGHLLLQRDQSATGKELKQQITIPDTWSAGVYFITIMDITGKTKSTNKFIVE